MALELPTKLPTNAIVDPTVVGRVRRGQRYRTVGWLGVLLSAGIYAATELTSLWQKEAKPAAIVGTAVAAISLLLINWTRLWVQESKEPFQYTFSVGEFESGASPAPAGAVAAESDPLEWLTRDLTEKLGERVSRLSLVEDATVPDSDPEGDPAAHVHISGWQGMRRAEDGTWFLEVVPRVRLGGKGAPAKLARTVRFKLRGEAATGSEGDPPLLSDNDYRRLLERVYWSVASQIYRQIRRGVERKVKLLPPGRLRAAAYLSEADDYAISNTLDAYEAARQLYRSAQEIYDVNSRREPATRWRHFFTAVLQRFDSARRRVRRWMAGRLRRFGRREVLTARAQLGYARMLVAEWHLKHLCGTVATDLYEAAPTIEKAIARLDGIPEDVAERESVLFRAYVTQAMARTYLQDPLGSDEALKRAERLLPTRAHDDAEFLFAAGMAEGQAVRALRLLAEAIEIDPAMERARSLRALRYEELWRSREPFEPEVAELVDAEYADVISVNPGNVSAWANRGYIGWLLANEVADEARRGDRRREPGWRERGIESLEAGRQYKEVRGDAMVADLDWNLARFAAEDGDFDRAYFHYVEAVSAMLGEPRLGFVSYYFDKVDPWAGLAFRGVPGGRPSPGGGG